MGAVQSVQLLWDERPCKWDELPDELQQKIYHDAVNNLSARELAIERHAKRTRRLEALATYQRHWPQNWNGGCVIRHICMPPPRRAYL
jgi:hypothetical protein